MTTSTPVQICDTCCAEKGKYGCACIKPTEYERLCETVAMFCKAKDLDEKSRDQMAMIISLAIRVGNNGYSPSL